MTTIFERNEDRVSGFLKWTDFNKIRESHNLFIWNCSSISKSKVVVLWRWDVTENNFQDIAVRTDYEHPMKSEMFGLNVADKYALHCKLELSLRITWGYAFESMGDWKYDISG